VRVEDPVVEAARECPSTHPVPLVSFEINYNVTDTTWNTTRWRVSSDNDDPSLPGGYSSHGDWFMGWDPSIMSTFVSNCLDTSMDCHSFLLGDGRTLY
jgi:hypothetical protein